MGLLESAGWFVERPIGLLTCLAAVESRFAVFAVLVAWSVACWAGVLRGGHCGWVCVIMARRCATVVGGSGVCSFNKRFIDVGKEGRSRLIRDRRGGQGTQAR